MTAVVTSQLEAAHSGVLARVAERWRPLGLYAAALDRNGALLWIDPQMPRALSVCLTTDSPLPQQIKRLGEAVTSGGVRMHAQLPWVTMQLVPTLKRRRVLGWIVLIARTDAVSATSEEAAHFAQKAAIDGQMLATLAAKVPLVPAAMFASLVRLVEQMHDDLQQGSVAGGELAGVTEQLTSVYEEISLLSRISSGMRFSQKPQAFLEMLCREVREVGTFRTVIVSLVKRTDESNPAELDEAAVEIGDGHVSATELLEALREPLHDALSVGETQVHNEIAADCDWARLRGQVKRFVCVPLERDHRPLGVLIAVDKQDASEFNSVDLKLLNNVGDQCSIFLENAALYRDMQDLFMGVLHALTQSIDAKDAYTRGHSQRVAEMSRDLARKVGLSDEQCERVYLSGLLHDVGKIGVPEAVLTKPGRLTDEEFEAIKKHPEIGAQILGNIRQLQDILPGVLYHHERWDGKGYPAKLSGENIPLIGRIICVADSFDAMSSTRTYRPALPLETVLAEIGTCAGRQFDPALAKAFITLDFSQYVKHSELSAPTESPPALPPGGRP